MKRHVVGRKPERKHPARPIEGLARPGLAREFLGKGRPRRERAQAHLVGRLQIPRADAVGHRDDRRLAAFVRKEQPYACQSARLCPLAKCVPGRIERAAALAFERPALGPHHRLRSMHVLEVMRSDHVKRIAGQIPRPWTLGEEPVVETKHLLDPAAKIDRLSVAREQIASAGKHASALQTKRQELSIETGTRDKMRPIAFDRRRHFIRGESNRLEIVEKTATRRDWSERIKVAVRRNGHIGAPYLQPLIPSIARMLASGFTLAAIRPITAVIIKHEGETSWLPI